MAYRSSFDIAYKLAKLLELGVNNKLQVAFNTAKELLRVSHGREIESAKLSNLMIKLTSVKCSKFKKLVYLYLSFTTSDDSHMWLQVMNSVCNDLCQPDAFSQHSALVLLADCLARSDILHGMRMSHLELCLGNAHQTVRKFAVSGISKYLKLLRSQKPDFSVLPVADKISHMVYIEDSPEVILQCIRCLYSLKSPIGTTLLISLLQRAERVEIWPKAEIISLVLQICESKVSNKEELLILNLIGPLLNRKYPLYFSLLCTTVVVSMSSHCSVSDLIKIDMIDQLLSLINIVPVHTRILYCLAIKLLVECPLDSRLAPYYNFFFPACSDCIYIKTVKVELLGRACCEDNCTYIFKVLVCEVMGASEYRYIKICMTSLLLVHQFIPDECEKFLIGCLNLSGTSVLCATIETIWSLLFSGNMIRCIRESTIIHLTRVFHQIGSESSKVAYLFCAATMVKSECNTLCLIDILSEEISVCNDHNPLYTASLFKLCFVLYQKSPSKLEHVCKNIFKAAAARSNLATRSLALSYFHLLEKVHHASQMNERGLLDLMKNCTLQSRQVETANVEWLNSVAALQ